MLYSLIEIETAYLYDIKCKILRLGKGKRRKKEERREGERRTGKGGEGSLSFTDKEGGKKGTEEGEKEREEQRGRERSGRRCGRRKWRRKKREGNDAHELGQGSFTGPAVDFPTRSG